MESEINSYTTTTLRLTEEEVVWLRALIQNGSSGGESQSDTEIRQKFWGALTPPDESTTVDESASYTDDDIPF